MRNKFNVFMLVSLFTVAANCNLHGDTEHEMRIDLTGSLGYISKIDKEHHFMSFDFVMPFFRTNNSLTFFSFMGVGHRFLFNQKWILGGYGFYDSLTIGDKKHLRRLTFGAEALSKHLEFRSNVYIPIGKKAYELYNHKIHDIRYNPNLGYTKFSFYHQRIIEKALAGFDVEVGGSLPRLSRLELFAAYYYFNADGVDAIHGVRIRSVFRVAGWLSIGGEVNYDHARGFSSYVSLKLSGDWVIGAGKRRPSNWVNRKVMMVPVRRLDIDNAVEIQKTEVQSEVFQGRVAAIYPVGTSNNGHRLINENVPVFFDSMDKLVNAFEIMGHDLFSQSGVDDMVFIDLNRQAAGNDSIALQSVKEATAAMSVAQAFQQPKLAVRFRAPVDAMLGEYGLMDDDFDALSRADKARVLNTFIKRDFSPANLNFMKNNNIDYENVVQIYQHPYPQNRPTGSAYLNIGNVENSGVDGATTGVIREIDGVIYVYGEPFGHNGGIIKEPQGVLGLTALGTDQDKLAQIHRCHNIQNQDGNPEGGQYRMNGLRSDPGYPGLTANIVKGYMTGVFLKSLRDLQN